VYIMNAQDCFSSFNKGLLALVRNRLFTAITRSKAWVRVSGIGSQMQGLTKEWQRLKENNYRLTFKYPTEEEKRHLRLINVEAIGAKAFRQRRLRVRSRDVLEAVKSGELDADQLIAELRRLKAIPRDTQ
jgi:superfamily I DNA and RNA helicase